MRPEKMAVQFYDDDRECAVFREANIKLVTLIPHTRSWKAEATFYRTQAEQAAANFKSRQWGAAGWVGIAFLLGLVLGWWVRG